MAKVITFSTKFPGYHPKAGLDTHFVASIFKSIQFEHLSQLSDFTKNHTIRKGNRYKQGDYFSPRIWGNDINPKSLRSGPYHSKQITLAPDILIKKIWKIEIYPTHDVYINGKFFCSFGSVNWESLAANDGLSSNDFRNWFNVLPFRGQIICWNDEVEY
jgi:hypothetical protein